MFPKDNSIELTKFYGEHGAALCTQGKVIFPFPHILGFDKSKKVNSFSCHPKVQTAFQFVFTEAAKTFGEDKYRLLGLDLFDGCYNNRLKRGSKTQWSLHSWGAAVDLNAAMNQIKWNKTKALFGKSEYEPFWKIVESVGLKSLGREKDFDWMHFQGAIP